MSIDYELRITVNFPSVKEANDIKRAARAAGMSPSQWIIFQLDIVKDFSARVAVKSDES